MTLSEIIREYCQEHAMSYRKFAELCGLTSGYLTMLLKNENPNTGKPLRPTIDTYAKLAGGMGMTINKLFEVMDDAPVSVNNPDTGIVSASFSREEIELVMEYRAAIPMAREMARNTLRSFPAEKKDKLA